jgi:ornithine decarboxylase
VTIALSGATPGAMLPPEPGIMSRPPGRIMADLVGLPAHWLASLHPEVLDRIDAPTPFLAIDLDEVRQRFQRFSAAMPRVRAFYAVKCNSTPEVLRTAAEQGAGFEIASLGELNMLEALGVDAGDVLYSNTVKPPAHVAGAAQRGVWRFAVDSEGELEKIARNAPGSAVYVRVRVDDSGSVFPLSRKFGAEAHHARALLIQARYLGLRPYGLTFHVGSQCLATSSWLQAIACMGRIMSQLLKDGIRIEMLDIGGGFPAAYDVPVPGIDQIGAIVNRALADYLPYQPALIGAEPGRHMVAQAAVMVSTVLGREERAGEEWLYVDVGAYNGLMETQQTVGQWRFPLWTSRLEHGLSPQLPFTITGPTCDSADTMFFGAPLPAEMSEGDRLYVGSAGAYTLSYASQFNGFPPPSCVFLNE